MRSRSHETKDIFEARGRIFSTRFSRVGLLTIICEIVFTCQLCEVRQRHCRHCVPCERLRYCYYYTSHVRRHKISHNQLHDTSVCEWHDKLYIMSLCECELVGDQLPTKCECALACVIFKTCSYSVQCCVLFKLVAAVRLCIRVK